MGQVNLICSVRTNGGELYIRSGPSLSHNIIGKNANGTTGLHVTQEENGWYYLADYGGWSLAQWMQIDQNLGTTVQTPKQEEVQAPKKQYTEDEIMAAYNETQSEYSAGSDEVDNLITKSTDGIYGMPYQFMSSVDPKIEGTMFGSIYADKIVSRMPLLLLAPGRVNFMRDFKNKDSGAQALLTLIEDGVGVDELKGATTYTGRYYTFDYDYTTYYQYVRAMCASGAYFLGIQDVKIKARSSEDGPLEWTPIKNVDWGFFGTDCFKKILSKREYVAFYVDSASSVSESFSNSTTESQLSSKLNSFSDAGRELRFLLGTAGGEELLQDQKDVINEAVKTVGKVSDKYLKGNQLFTDIANNFSTIAVGGKLIFPEIWADSEFSNSYDINIKLRSPDCDKLSWFMNIYVPLAHLICLTAPRESDTADANGYISPFLVRAFYKGLFNCDMGIITDLSITRGKEKAWTLDGLPTEVDVSVTIKDLYKMMSISSGQNAGAFVNNISLMDYIANSCGININEPSYTRSIEIYKMLKGQKFTHIWSDVWSSLTQNIGSRVMDTQNKLTNLLGFADQFLPM